MGALFAVLSYSSLAAVLLTSTLAGAGLISLPVALGLVIGANIGSGLLAWFNASLQPASARRVALGNLLYKLAGLIVLPFLVPLVAWMDTLGYSAQTQVIGFHLVYNSLRCLLLLPTVHPMSRLCERLLPERQLDNGVAQPRHLDPAALDTPSLALANAVRETLRIGDMVELMLARLLEVLREDRAEPGEEIRRLDDDVDALYSGVKLYLAQMPREDLAEQEGRRWAEIIELAINLEQAGDIIEHMASKVQNLKTAKRRSFSDSGLEELGQLHAQLSANLRLGLSVFISGDSTVRASFCSRSASSANWSASWPIPCASAAPTSGGKHRDQRGASGADCRHETAQFAVLQRRLSGSGRPGQAAHCRRHQP